MTLARGTGEDDDVESIGLGELVERCWRHVEAEGAELVVETDREVRANRSRLQQLLGNLVRNAVEHGGDDVTVRVGALPDGFYVADDGTGIARAVRDETFEADYSTAPEGTGVGLNVLTRIADGHGWTVTVTESERGGARVEVTGVETIM